MAQDIFYDVIRPHNDMLRSNSGCRDMLKMIFYGDSRFEKEVLHASDGRVKLISKFDVGHESAVCIVSSQPIIVRN